ncbi:hypothetical protein LAZ67_7002247 [Cordylochernes scorpioides]|uniref:Reverse transcriptase domain-containing protein n=1 Tax=Cordylochernes scorpioides TaxID=51811 RepID=A0ABY6KPY1_9ARAC|nr:hypothetical protein LAZ67_7002247 [Cordylochernes scorpioides]
MGRKRANTSSKEDSLEERRNLNLPFEFIPRYVPDVGLSYSTGQFYLTIRHNSKVILPDDDILRVVATQTSKPHDDSLLPGREKRAIGRGTGEREGTNVPGSTFRQRGAKQRAVPPFRITRVSHQPLSGGPNEAMDASPVFTDLCVCVCVCGENNFNIKPLNIQPLRLRLSDKKPVCVRPYRHSLRDRDLLKQQIEQLLKYGLIKPASSPYSAPVTLAPKKGEGRVRLCIDFRLLNKKIISDSFPIPLMEDIVQKVQGARISLSTYCTIPLHPKDREVTCFSTSEGSYVWCRLPFGLKTAPEIFNRKLSAILQKYKLDNVASYFDYILIFSENEESHLKHLGQISEILKKKAYR